MNKQSPPSLASSASRSRRVRASDLDLLFACLVFMINAALCIAFISPEVQGLGDAIRGWRQFNEIYAPGPGGWGPANQVDLRILMVGFALLELLVLRRLKLIEHSTLVTFLALPAAAYCVTKIKIEFVFFPLAIISTRLTAKQEAAVLVGLVALSSWLDEKNGYVIVAFRLAVLFFRRFPVRPVLVLAILGLAVAVGSQFNFLADVVPGLAGYQYTREFANPDYSVVETVGVFAASSILSINPDVDYWFSIPSSLLVLAFLFGRRAFRRETWQKAWGAAELKAALLTVVSFTAITHAFQNARYYLFYIPLLRAGRGEEGTRRLMILSVPVTVLLIGFYSVSGLLT